MHVGVMTKIYPTSLFGKYSIFPITICVLPHLLGIVFTLMVIYYDKICYCCGKGSLGAEERMVYDPSQPEKILLWKDGKVL